MSGAEIEAELEADITTVNPPIFQGWAVIPALMVFLGVIPGIAAFVRGDVLPAIGLLLLPAVTTLLLALFVGHIQREVELDESGVRIRRWTDIWFDRPGVRLGPPNTVRVSTRGSTRLHVESATQAVAFAIPFWPRSALQDLHDELPIWGVQGDAAGESRRRGRRHG